MNKDLEKIIKEIECYQNEDMCLIMLSQKENKALLDYITNLQQLEQEHQRINGELREELTNLQKENDGLKNDLENEVADNKLRLQELTTMVKDDERSQETIIRLTKENERLKEWKEDLLKENIELENIRKEVIEYMQENYNELTDYGYKKEIYDDLLNILQNGGEDNE